LDRDKALALELVMREECPNCHTLPEDWVDAETNYPLETPVFAAVTRHCHGCDQIEALQNKIPKKARGAYVALIPFDLLDDEDDAILDAEDAYIHQVPVT
jgi:hypothetical protein